ncbi:hypothetical protein D3C72_1924260 [compost metagenome]
MAEALERLEQQGLFVFADAETGVLDDQPQAGRGGLVAERDVAVRTVVFHRIAQQVEQGLAQPARLCANQ